MDIVVTLSAIGDAEHIPVVNGIDLAKNVFALHAINRHSKALLVKPKIRRDQLLNLPAQLVKFIVSLMATFKVI